MCSAAFLQWFSFPFSFVHLFSVSLLDLAVTLNDHSHDSVDPRLLNFHLRSELPDSAEFLEKEVQQAVVVDQHVRMNADFVARVF